jgi:hypothetical protein
MAPKYHPTPLSGGGRKALKKELARARAMTTILAGRAVETRAAGETLIRQTCFARAGTNACGATAVRPIRRRRSTRPSTAAMAGSISAARAAARRDKTARNFLAAIHLAAAIVWLN